MDLCKDLLNGEQAAKAQLKMSNITQILIRKYPKIKLSIRKNNMSNNRIKMSIGLKNTKLLLLRNWKKSNINN